MVKSQGDPSFEKDDAKSDSGNKARYRKDVLMSEKDNLLDVMKKRMPVVPKTPIKSAKKLKISSKSKKKRKRQTNTEDDSYHEADNDVKLVTKCKKGSKSDKAAQKDAVDDEDKLLESLDLLRKSRRVATTRKNYDDESDEDVLLPDSSATYFQIDDIPEWDDDYAELDEIKKDMDNKLNNSEEDIDPNSIKSSFVKINTYTDTLTVLKKKLEIRNKYMHKYSRLPIAPYFEELKTQLQPYLHLVPDLLKARADSFYYACAKQMSQSSNRPSVTEGDIKSQLMVSPGSINAGAYGLKRQFQVGEWIIDTYQDDILKRYSNPVVKWWGYEDFARYILSCDLLVYLLKDQMKLETLDEAFAIMQDTVEYGHYVSDDEPFHPWELDIEQEKIEELGLAEEHHSTFYRQHKP